MSLKKPQPTPCQNTGQTSNKALNAQRHEKCSASSLRRFFKFIQCPPYPDAEGPPPVRVLPWERPSQGPGKGQAK